MLDSTTSTADQRTELLTKCKNIPLPATKKLSQYSYVLVENKFRTYLNVTSPQSFVMGPYIWRNNIIKTDAV